MDIYGIKKSIQVIEQVFLDMTNVPSVVMVEKSILNDGIHYKCKG